jgi:hypothetical protein
MPSSLCFTYVKRRRVDYRLLTKLVTHDVTVMIMLRRTVQNGLVHRTGRVWLITKIRPPLSVLDYRYVFLKLVL